MLSTELNGLRNDPNTADTAQLPRTQPTILFNISKKEQFTPKNGFKTLQRRLRSAFKIGLFKEDMNLSKLADANLLIFGAPREKFSTSEFSALKGYLERGGSILYLANEGGESVSNTNFNYLLEEYGMTVNPDATTRTVMFKYFHPKEVHVSNGVLNRELNRAAGKKSSNTTDQGPLDPGKINPNALTFVYPFGATLNVQKTSSAASIVRNGSAQMFSDEYIEKEENGKLFDVLIQLLTSDKIILNSIDSNEPDISDYHYLPETAKLSETLRSCLQESEDLPKDFTTMFDMKLFKFGTDLIPTAARLYSKMHLKHEPLTLIQPQFETPLPPLLPAVFPPKLKDLPTTLA
ncbi:hypothetical protein BASA60_004300 [Batrachochytrium salamandrivorans]|nr:hypothetical protein BASA60_004300 [Batrachochytrium salamandrivorans]